MSSLSIPFFMTLLYFVVSFLQKRRRKARRLLENAIAFSSCVGEFEDVIQCPAGLRESQDPTGT